MRWPAPCCLSPSHVKKYTHLQGMSVALSRCLGIKDSKVRHIQRDPGWDGYSPCFQALTVRGCGLTYDGVKVATTAEAGNRDLSQREALVAVVNLGRQDKGQAACARAFVDATMQGLPAPIPIDEVIEASRVSIGLQRMLGA